MLDVELLQAIDEGEAQDWEFKSAKGGVPASMYESYSAMANSRGGVIVLGVEEKDGKFWIDRGLEKPAKLRQDIWNALNNRGKVSINLLADADVSVRELQGKTLIVMHVPRAGRRQRPVYVGQNPLDGTYRRNNEGDYHCSRDEVGRMLADQAEETADLRILDGFGWNDIDEESLAQYRQRFASVRPTHDWLSRDNKALLEKLQGWRTDRITGSDGLTVAGLLMFGKWEAIRDADALPQFHLDYREILTDDPRIRWTDRLIPDGTWQANLFQFYQRTIVRATRDLKTPFYLHDLTRIDDSPIHEAIREALTNAIIHADYRGQGGIVIIRRAHGFELSNPGSLLISVEQMRRGGVSECRNKALQFMFQMMGRGDKGGTGIDTILKGWREEHWRSPSIQETAEPDRVILRLPMISVFPDEALKRLRMRFGKRMDGMPHVELQALVTADIEGEVSNSRLQLMSDSHPVELTRAHHKLVMRDLLVSRGHGRGTIYLLPYDETPNVGSETSNVGSETSNVGSETSNVGSETSNVGSETSNVGSETPNVGSGAGELTGTSGAEDLERLRKPAYSSDVPLRMAKARMRMAILRVCDGGFLTAAEIARALHRDTGSLRDRYLTPMVREGTLQPRYPHSPHHTQQAYRSTHSIADEATDGQPDPGRAPNITGGGGVGDG